MADRADLSDVVVPEVEEAGPGPVHPAGLQPRQRHQGVVVQDELLQPLVVGVEVRHRLQARDLHSRGGVKFRLYPTAPSWGGILGYTLGTYCHQHSDPD